MLQIVSRRVCAGLRRTDFAGEQPVARCTKGWDWLEEATSAGQYDAVGGLIVIPADGF
jgi:hypothetical protein